jgi:hypothetical protein
MPNHCLMQPAQNCYQSKISDVSRFFFFWLCLYSRRKVNLQETDGSDSEHHYRFFILYIRVREREKERAKEAESKRKSKSFQEEKAIFPLAFLLALLYGFGSRERGEDGSDSGVDTNVADEEH